MSKEQILGDKSQNQKNNNFDNCFFSSVWRQLCSEGSKTIRVTSQTRTESIFYPCWDPGNHQSMARGKTEKRVAWGTKQRRQAEVQLECIGIRYSFIWHHMHGILNVYACPCAVYSIRYFSVCEWVRRRVLGFQRNTSNYKHHFEGKY